MTTNIVSTEEVDPGVDEDAFMKKKLKQIMLERKVTEVYDIMQVDAEIVLKLQN